MPKERSAGRSGRSRRSPSPRRDISDSRREPMKRGRDNYDSDSNSPRHGHHNLSSSKSSHRSRPYSPESRSSNSKHYSRRSPSPRRKMGESSKHDDRPTRKTEKDREPEIEGEDEEAKMMRLMGFGGFDSTKGKQVPGNNVSAVHVIHKRKYRQYMNRKGGFNRPLDFVA